MRGKRILLGVWVLAAVFFGMHSIGVAGGVVTGNPAPDFTLKDTQGKTHSLEGVKGKFVVLEWTNYDCPFVKKYYGSGRMQELQKTCTGRGVIWFLICSSAPGKQGNYPPETWNKMAAEKGAVPTAILPDPDGRVGRAYGAKATPHMFVINPDGILVYQGAIDSIPSTDPADIPKAENYVEAALFEAMNGRPVSKPSTQAYGCSVKY
ncbi:MAG TPA: thioredoxin family protein [Candidatus Omnitrophota bacterium]|nr:thioredoxin family protein [Candidatus Omnitrophota bacterium]